MPLVQSDGPGELESLAVVGLNGRPARVAVQHVAATDVQREDGEWLERADLGKIGRHTGP